ncbi:MAG: hypothetical protein AAFX87_16215 [Bacteroidota bacterium]
MNLKKSTTKLIITVAIIIIGLIAVYVYLLVDEKFKFIDQAYEESNQQHRPV